MTISGEFGHQFRKQERDFNKLKQNAEELLKKKVMTGTIKIGSEEYDKRMQVIEYYDVMSYRHSEIYNSND